MYYISLNRPLGRFSLKVEKLICLDVCAIASTPSPQKNISLFLDFWDFSFLELLALRVERFSGLLYKIFYLQVEHFLGYSSKTQDICSIFNQSDWIIPCDFSEGTLAGVVRAVISHWNQPSRHLQSNNGFKEIIQNLLLVYFEYKCLNEI